MSNGLTVYGVVPDATQFIRDMGESIAKSRLLGCENEHQGRVMAMACLAKRTDPLQLAQQYHIIQGNLSMKADAMLAGFRARGGKHKQIERSSDAAEIELTIDGETNRYRFTMQEALQEKFPYAKDGKTLKDNWATPRGKKSMLWARVISEGVGAMAPEVNTGIYTPEEVQDFDEGVAAPPAVVESGTPAPPADASQEDIIDAEFEAAKATGAEIARLTELFQSMGLDPVIQLKAINSTGARDMGDLTSDGAKTIIAKLEAKLAEVKAAETNAAESATDASSSDGAEPCTEVQVEQVKSLIRSITQIEGCAAMPEQIKLHMEKHGVAKLVSLTHFEVQTLIDALTAKDLSPFLSLSLEGSAKNG